MTKAYVYGGSSLGKFDTRHEAVGYAAIQGRLYSDNLLCPWNGPLDATQDVMHLPTAVCGGCGRIFEYDSELEEHRPCPDYVRRAQSRE